MRTTFSLLSTPRITPDVELDVEFEPGLDVSAVSAAPPPIVMSPPLDSIRPQLLIVTPPLAPVVQNVISPPEEEIVLVVEASVPAEVVIRPADLIKIPWEPEVMLEFNADVPEESRYTLLPAVIAPPRVALLTETRFTSWPAVRAPEPVVRVEVALSI